MTGNYFEDLKNQSGKNKILVGIIIALLIINLIMFKSVVNIASNKTVEIQVPTFLEQGKYVIGGTFANEKVFKMWTKLWVEELANYSYKDVRSRVNNITEFLAPETFYSNKASLYKFVDFVEKNFITQSFSPENFAIKDLQNGYYSIAWTGQLKRQIGIQEDSLSNLTYRYEFICFVRNGQIYIHSLKNDVAFQNDPAILSKLKQNEFVNFQIKPVSDEDKARIKREKEEDDKRLKEKLSNETKIKQEELNLKNIVNSEQTEEIVPTKKGE